MNNLIIDSFAEETKVYMSKLSDAEIYKYIATKEPMDKAGAYAIQGQSGVFIEKIDGDYYNVVGLPIPLLYQKLKHYKIMGLGLSCKWL